MMPEQYAPEQNQGQQASSLNASIKASSTFPSANVENRAAPLDLRTTKCPLNFVKARLALEKLPVGGILELWILADSQSAVNIPQSIQQEGHLIVDDQLETDGLRRLRIQRC